MSLPPCALLLDGALGELLVARASLRPGDDIEVTQGVRPDRVHGPLPAIDALFPTPEDRAAITVVILGVGPGSYTGVRSAASAAIGLARALNVPLVSVASDDALRLASGRDAALPMGARESLLVEAHGSRIVASHEAPTPPTLDAVGDRYAQALMKLAGSALRASKAAPGEVHVRYPAPPRGLGGAPGVSE